jgi:hypothetical protein
MRSALAIACILLACGYVLSYFFTMSPSLEVPLTDRVTRISTAGTAGSSLLVAILLARLVQNAHRPLLRRLAILGVTAFLTMLFLYTFTIQQDYVDDWQEQRAEIAQILLVTPDAAKGSVIIIKHRIPDGPAFILQRGPRGIGIEKTIFEWQFPHLCIQAENCPQLFYVYSDTWQKHLRLDSEGYMAWTQTNFDGRFYQVSGRFRPGRFIVLDGTDPRHVVRRAVPIYADGQQIVQLPPAEWNQPSFWASHYDTPFSRLFLFDFAWKPRR